MKRQILVFLMSILAFNAFGQKLISCDNDTTFTREYVDDEEWNILPLGGDFLIGISTTTSKDQYGKFYQLKLSISNHSGKSYTFDPGEIRTYVIDDEFCDLVTTYTAQRFQKKMRNKQAWTKFFNDMNAALAAWNTEYTVQSLDNNVWVTPTTKYDAAAALQATADNQYLRDRMNEDRRTRDAGYLKKNTIHPNETILGYMNIKFLKGKQMNMIIPFKGKQYVFIWDVTKKALR